MSTPFDLCPQPPPGDPNRETTQQTLRPVAPTGRASDVFFQPQPIPIRGGRPHHAVVNGGERGATPFDGFATGLFWLALFAAGLCLGYYLYALWAGGLADPNFSNILTHDDRARVLGNLANMQTACKVALVVGVIPFMFLFYDEELSGYMLVAIAVVMYLGIAFLTSVILQALHVNPSYGTQVVLGYMRELSLYLAVPGGLLILMDLFRRTRFGLENVRNARSKLRYGQGAVKPGGKIRNTFLGSCWNLPFCKDSTRNRCPVFAKKLAGACWRKKRGCMCDQTIAVQSTNLKLASAAAGAGRVGEQASSLLGGLMPQHLSWGQKKHRCRECVIFNHHQEQKYKALVLVTLLGVGLLVYQFEAQIPGWVASSYGHTTEFLGSFALTPHSAVTAAPTAGNSAIPSPVTNDPAGQAFNGLVGWMIAAVFGTIVLSKVLQVIEYLCFRLKV